LCFISHKKMKLHNSVVQDSDADERSDELF
jgi:hypothetical protein